MRRPFTVAAGLALVAALSACDDEPEPPADLDGAEYAVDSTDTYVAFGDSYTAAPRTGPVAGDDDGCGRTARNYPHLIEKETGVRLLDNSCNGADTDNLTEQQRTARGWHPPQLEGLSSDTDLVTFRLGANDNSLIGRIFYCAQERERRLTAGLGEPPTTCTDLDENLGPAKVDTALRELATDVERGLEQIHDRAPEARIIVVSYPQIIPPDGTCDLLPLPDGDEPWARQIIDGLNDALRDGAEAVGATFIDVFKASKGHDICADEPWIAGIEATRGDATKWHPYREESQLVAKLVLEELQQ